MLLFPIQRNQGQRPGTLLVSPYICRLPPVFSRSTHCSWSNPISFWIVYSWGFTFFWSHSISFTLWLKRVKKHIYPLLLNLIHCVLQFHIFCKRTKIFLRAQKYPHFEFLMFFKGDAISHPLNPGATPWYFVS